MLKKFLIFVIDDLSESGTPAEMIAIDAFNDSLRTKGHWIFAGGLAAPVHADVIDNRNNTNLATGKTNCRVTRHYKTRSIQKHGSPAVIKSDSTTCATSPNYSLGKPQ